MMRNDHYPSGIVKYLLQTDLVKENTSAVLKDRLKKEHIIIPVFFDRDAFQILQSVCKRLIPQPNRSNIIDLPGLLDEQLTSGTGKGWRYNQMPPGKTFWSAGLNGINETSQLMYDKAFTLLAEAEQDKVLTEIQCGIAEGTIWESIPPALFFEEFLASITELYYSHPVAKEEIGEVAFADAKGWQKIGLNELEAHEPAPLKKTGDDK